MAARRDLPRVALNYADERGSHPLPVYDARPLRSELSLDREGFLLCRHESLVSEFYDAGQVKTIYYPEIEALLEGITGARKAFAFEHDVRKSRGGDGAEVRRPVPVVHDDYTEKSAPERVRLYLPDEAEELLHRRFAVINVWRSIKGPVLESPLAVCDAQSLDPTDRIPTSEGVKHEVYLFRFRPAHRWFYFPAMRPDEALLLKCYDSARDGRARFTAHSAFNDPAPPPDAPPRESIEVRALVFFDA